MSKFKAIETPIKNLVIIEPVVFGDERGFFMESYSARDFADIGINVAFVQDNHSKSGKGVLRGLHFQTSCLQDKLMRVTSGSVLDVVVDLRPESKTFGRSEQVILSAKNKRQLFVPKHFAHGFLTLEDDTEFLYKCSDYYAPKFDAGILWNDPALAIDWRLDEFGIAEPLLSEKDRNHPIMSQINFKTLWK